MGTLELRKDRIMRVSGQYDKGLNDFHIDTALRRAVKGLV